jgi:hypothetical protein
LLASYEVENEGAACTTPQELVRNRDWTERQQHGPDGASHSMRRTRITCRCDGRQPQFPNQPQKVGDQVIQVSGYFGHPERDHCALAEEQRIKQGKGALYVRKHEILSHPGSRANLAVDDLRIRIICGCLRTEANAVRVDHASDTAKVDAVARTKCL